MIVPAALFKMVAQSANAFLVVQAPDVKTLVTEEGRR
jgi:hypothetical protein